MYYTTHKINIGAYGSRVSRPEPGYSRSRGLRSPIVDWRPAEANRWGARAGSCCPSEVPTSKTKGLQMAGNAVISSSQRNFNLEDILPDNILEFASRSSPVLSAAAPPAEAHTQTKHVLPASETSTHCPCPEHDEVTSPQASWISWQVEKDAIGWFENGGGMGDCWRTLLAHGSGA